MLSIERKKTEKVDFIKPLQEFIRNNYSADSLQDHQEAINGLQQLREELRNCEERNTALRDLLCRYWVFLSSIETRFPFSENQIRVSFVWYDSLKGKKTSQYSIHFEKENILFNLGGIYCHLGSLQNRSTKDGLKTAYQNFQTAAGIFQELKNELERHPQSIMLDLSFEYINAVIYLMLAQAQECFYETGTKENINAGLISKLAVQTADYYLNAFQQFSSPMIASLLPKQWLSHIALKCAMMNASGEYRYALVHSGNGEYGMQVARLAAAVMICEDAKKKHFRYVSGELQQAFSSLESVIVKAHEAAEKENDTIYHDTVPASSSLPLIERKSMAKPLPLPENAVLTREKDPFLKLIPFAITEKLSVYQEKKDTLVRNELKAIDENNQIALATLSSMNLPGAIEAMEVSPGIPETLKGNMKVLKSEGGVRLIIEQLDVIQRLAREDASILDGAVRSLDEEEGDDSELRKHYGVRWQRTPSHTLTVSLRQEIAKYRGYLEHGSKSDAYVAQKFRDMQQNIVRLNGSEEEILKILPGNQNTSNLSNSPIVNALKQSLTLLDRLIAERTSLRNQLNTLNKSDDISSALLAETSSSSGVSEDALFVRELKKYEDIQNSLEKTFVEQARLLDQIRAQNEQFVSGKQQQRMQGNDERGQILQQLNDAYKVFKELKGNLVEAVQFYTDLQEQLKQFSGKCSDFIVARRSEKQDLLREINSQASVQSSYPPSYASSTTNSPGQRAYPIPPNYQTGNHPVQNLSYPLGQPFPPVSYPPYQQQQQQAYYYQPAPPSQQYQQYQQPQQSQQPPLDRKSVV